jgi:hypothetical protein
MSSILRRFTRSALAATAATFLFSGAAFAQKPAPNYDEAKVPKFELPDPLVAADGTKIATADDWRNKRRPELLALFEQEMFGKRPSVAPEKIKFEELTSDSNALGGKATRKEIRIYFDAPNQTPKADLLLYIPNDRKGPAPVFVMPNFEGNWATTDDPGVRAFEIDGHYWNAGKTPEQTRGAVKGRWSFDRIVSRGYAVATLCYEEVDADFDDGFKNGVHPLFGERSDAGDETASIAAWAWALSRALDCLETLPEIDATKAIVAGHSRLGKTALWAGAQDERFAAVISNNSGCGGAALSRREFGETVAKINKSFPHWFCDNYNKYNDNEEALLVDQQGLIALIAPRPVYVASATEDTWADPEGEFLSALYASPVYELYGKKGLAVSSMPKPEQPSIEGYVGYHIRTGKHDITLYDWQQYIKFANKYFK